MGLLKRLERTWGDKTWSVADQKVGRTAEKGGCRLPCVRSRWPERRGPENMKEKKGVVERISCPNTPKNGSTAQSVARGHKFSGKKGEKLTREEKR